MQSEKTSREYNQHPTMVKKAAAKGPVIITERGTPAYVMMSYHDYCNLTVGQKSILDSLHIPGAEDIEFKTERDTSTAKIVDF